MGQASSADGGSRGASIKRRRKPGPAPIRTSFRCPRCGGPHPIADCDAPRAA